MPVGIRAALLNDLDAICCLADEIGQLHHDNSPNIFAAPPGFERDRVFWLAAIEAEHGTVFVAQENGLVCGFISAKIIEAMEITFLNRRRVCRIGTIVVAAGARGKGVGSLLVDAVKIWAKAASAAEIRLDVFDFNRDAMAFYQKSGFAFQAHIMSLEVE